MNSPENVYWFVLHITQIIIFQFYAAKKMSSLTCQLLRNRNAHVAQDVLKGTRILHSNLWDYIIGIVSLGLLVTGYLQDHGPLYWSGKYLSLFGFLFTVLTLDLLKYEKLKKIIQLETKRSASLNSRKVGNIIPTWNWVLYSIVMLSLTYLEETQWGQVTNVITATFIIGAAYYTENRSKIPGKTKDDETYRRNEMLTITVIAWTIPISVPARKYLGHFGIDGIFSALPIVMFIIFLNTNVYKTIMKGSAKE